MHPSLFSQTLFSLLSPSIISWSHWWCFFSSPFIFGIYLRDWIDTVSFESIYLPFHFKLQCSHQDFVFSWNLLTTSILISLLQSLTIRIHSIEIIILLAAWKINLRPLKYLIKNLTNLFLTTFWDLTPACTIISLEYVMFMKTYVFIKYVMKLYSFMFCFTVFLSLFGFRHFSKAVFLFSLWNVSLSL